jgi:hypothetical protein
LSVIPTLAASLVGGQQCRRGAGQEVFRARVVGRRRRGLACRGVLDVAELDSRVEQGTRRIGRGPGTLALAWTRKPPWPGS